MKEGMFMKLNPTQIQKLSKIKNSLYEDIKIEFLYHSNHLEGSTFSIEGLTKLLLENKVEGTHSLDDIIETRNSLDVFDQVVKDVKEPLNKFLVLSWHKILKKNTVDDEIHNAGVWKQYENRLKNIDLKVAYPSEVDNLMYNLLLDWTDNSGNNTIDDIAKFHAKFEHIHPFQDGNGRIGRFIILKQCLEENIDLIAIDEEYEDEYKEALYIAQSTEDYSPLIVVFEKCQKRLDEKLSSMSSVIDSLDDNTEI